MFSGASSNALHLQGNVPQVQPDIHRALIVTRGHLVKAVRLWYWYHKCTFIGDFFLNQGIMPIKRNSYSFEENKWLKSDNANRGGKWKKVVENFRFFFRLHQVSSHPQSILGLCALFENIIQKVISFSGQNSKDVLVPLNGSDFEGSFSARTRSLDPPSLLRHSTHQGCVQVYLVVPYIYKVWRGVRSDAQLSCTETRFQKCC